VIDALDVALNSTGLSNPSKSTLRECRRLSVALYNEAISLQADGCQTLKHAYEDLEVESTNQSGTVCILQAVHAMFPSICEAADSLLHWAAGEQAPPEPPKPVQKAEKPKVPILTEPMTKKELADLFVCHRNDVAVTVLAKYPHETVGTTAKPKYRLQVANMPPAYSEKHRTK